MVQLTSPGAGRTTASAGGLPDLRTARFGV